ncbi:MAG: hypothetical protein QNJ94_07495 [Alphaproteobacteria bacterium]|nr:hypothetical protein [Alphaproteobacteria bacterium]
MDLTIVIAFLAIILFLAYVSWSVTQTLKAVVRRVVAVEERVSDLEDELARHR